MSNVCLSISQQECFNSAGAYRGKLPTISPVDALIPCLAATQHPIDEKSERSETRCPGPAAPETTNVHLSPPAPSVENKAASRKLVCARLHAPRTRINLSACPTHCARGVISGACLLPPDQRKTLAPTCKTRPQQNCARDRLFSKARKPSLKL